MLRLAVLAMSLSLCCAAGASAATLQLVGKFEQPIFITSDPANPDRLFVVEREGRVMRVENGAGIVFADLTALVSCCESERGLLSIALAPDFDASGRFYAAYTGKASAGGAEGDIHVDAFRHEGAALVREPLFSVGHSANDNHNGGQLEFGPDGYLYVSIGDGGGGGDPFESGQSLSTLLGKILRVEPRPGAEPAIWSYGLRNPWRFSFDRADGNMVIADVGQGSREEVDLAPSPTPGVVGGSGRNYGWNCREGFIAYSEPGASCAGAGPFAEPVFDYPHTQPKNGGAHGCSITGGYVVRDPRLGDLYGRYVYADYCVGEVRSLVLPSTAGGLATGDRFEGLNVVNPVSFGEDSCGRLYAISQDGPVYRFAGPKPANCSEPAAAAPSQAAPGAPPAGTRKPMHTRLKVTLREAGGGSRPLLAVRVSPCAENGGRPVQLNRGGKRFAAKALDRQCTARFRVDIGRRSTFRAVLLAGGYRSQVLTIALAKPRP
jgi:hypothetical protein